MSKEEEKREEVDALCPECGHAFKVYLDRVLSEMPGQAEEQKAECPVCGCGECKVGK